MSSALGRQIAILAISCSGLFCTTRAMAGATVTDVTVVKVIAQSGGAGGAYFVYASGPPSGVAPCGTVTSTQYRFVIDPTTQIGAAMIANALTAYATGTTVDIYGLGTCGIWPDTETIELIALHQG